MHGNFAALQAVIQDVEAQHPDEVLVGGDLVLGGRQPAGVVDLLIERRWPAVLGNTDAFVVKVAAGTADQSDPDLPMATWALDRLSAHHLDYLRGLRTLYRRALPGGRALALVHATPWNLVDIVLPDAPDDIAGRMLREGEADVLVYGHIHCAYHREVDAGLVASVGGVAWSNDRDPRPAYSIVTVEHTVSVQVRRVAYDSGAELAAIDRSGLPLSAAIRRLMGSGGRLQGP